MVRRFCYGVLVVLALTVLFAPILAQPVLPSAPPAVMGQAAQWRDSDPILDDRLGAMVTCELLWWLSARLWPPWNGWWPER